MRLREVAVGTSLLALAACAANNTDGPGRQDILIEIGLRQAIGLANDLVAIYGVDIPEDATASVVATREYAEVLCSVAIDGAPVSDLDGPRIDLDATFARLTAEGDLEPALMLTLLRLKSTALDVTELVLLPDTDPERFRVPCERLRAIPEILPRA